MALVLPPYELQFLADFYLPYFHDAANDQFLIHASSASFAIESPYFKGYDTEATRKWVMAYLGESRRTFQGDGRTEPTKPYDWSVYFTDALSPRPYQFAGMERLYYRLINFTKGVLLGDDVGLGKTIIMLGVYARLRSEKKIRRAAVVTTTSALGQWHDEINRFLIDPPTVATVQGTSANKARLLESHHDVVAMSYPTIRDPKYEHAITMLSRTVDLVNLDETSAIINPASRAALMSHQFASRARYRIAANATPNENALADLYAQFYVLDSNCVGSRDSFLNRYTTRDNYGHERKYFRVPELRRRLAVLSFRRTKEDCGVQFPEVISQARRVDMPPKHAAAYDAAVGEFVKSKDIGQVGLAQLAKVQIAALLENPLDPRSPSPKLDDLVTLLDTELKGQQVILFTRFKTILAAAQHRLAHHRPLIIHGTVTQPNRDIIRRDFTSTNPSSNILMGTDAMSRGLNLQTAGTVINLELPWNPSRLRQRIGRVHRIGQTRGSILVINYLAGHPSRPTVDDWFYGIVQRKRNLFEAMWGEEDTDDLGAEADTIDLAAVRRFLSGQGI